MGLDGHSRVRRNPRWWVDGEWVHSGTNPLWEALGEKSRVTVVIMRGGFPKTFELVIE